MTLQLTLNSTSKLEFAFGKITTGKEMQLFGEYFPALTPLIEEHGCQQVGSFVVIASNTKNTAPEMGAFTQWPSEENFKNFYSDPRFIKLKALRDDSLDLLCDGHFFNPVDKVIDINTDDDYAIVISKEDPMGLKAMLNLPLEVNSPTQTYSGKSITLSLWDDNADNVLAAPSKEAEIFRVRFNAPTS